MKSPGAPKLVNAASCPRCDLFLSRSRWKSKVIEKCGQCHGQWVPGRSVSKLYPALRRDDFESKSTGDLSCPRCPDTDLDRGSFPLAHNVTLDRCPSCQGLWLDAFEANAMESALSQKKGASKKKRWPSRKTKPRGGTTPRENPYPKQEDNPDEYDIDSFWRNVPRALTIAFNPLRVILVLCAAAFVSTAHVLGGVFFPFLAISLGFSLLLCLKALQHGSNGRRAIFFLTDYEGFLVSVLHPLVQMVVALLITVFSTSMILASVPEAQSGVALVLLAAWPMVSTPTALIVVAIGGGLFSVLNPFKWFAVLKASPLHFFALAIVFNLTFWLVQLSQGLWELIPTVGAFLNVWFGLSVAIGACHMLGVWVHCNREHIG